LCFSENQKKDTEENKVIERFYGPTNNCSVLKKLGYTLNGYNLVNNGTASSHHILEISLCKFHQPLHSGDRLINDIVGTYLFYGSETGIFLNYRNNSENSRKGRGKELNRK